MATTNRQGIPKIRKAARNKRLKPSLKTTSAPPVGGPSREAEVTQAVQRTVDAMNAAFSANPNYQVSH